MSCNCLALDFGASSGRIMLGKYDGERIDLLEIHRFPNEPVVLHKRVYWDFLRLMHEVKIGLKKASNLNIKIHGIGVTTWGVDYGFLDKSGNLMQNPIHYRDNRTYGILEKIEEFASKEDIYKSTGIQYMNLNTLYQLISDKEIRYDIYEKAENFLMMPDLFNYFLCKIKKNEYTEATTSQLLDPHTKNWDYELMDRLKIRKDMFCEIVMPATVIGKLTDELEEETGLYDVNVISVAGHDTASAVAGAPIDDENSAFLSSGTWSLIGKELKEAIISDEAMESGFTNEGGAEGTITYLKNITGLWILQQLKKQWEALGEDVTFQSIIEASRCEIDKGFSIDPNSEEFSFPKDMGEAISNHCEKKGQGKPKTLGELASAVYNGLASQYKTAVLDLEKTTKTKINTINMVGGGVQDELLCEMTAKSTGKTVVVGPIEAAILGNIIMQLKALGEIDSIKQGREIIKRSFDFKIYR